VSLSRNPVTGARESVFPPRMLKTGVASWAARVEAAVPSPKGAQSGQVAAGWADGVAEAAVPFPAGTRAVPLVVPWAAVSAAAARVKATIR
jgi:hypothetical protein